MGPIDLLLAKRRCGLTDDEAVVLLALGKGERRPADLLDRLGLPERSFWRLLARMRATGWLGSDERRPCGVSTTGTGRFTVLSLTPEGRRMLALLRSRRPPRRRMPAPAAG
jgi:DNA-binding MarR family transcriptional regulator